jgi:Integrase zinc binding domain
MILQLPLLIAAHSGPGGHHGITTTEQAMNGFVHWTSMRKDLASFCELLHPLLEYFNWRNCAKINGVIATCCDAKQAASIWLPSHLTWTEGRPLHFRPLSRSLVLLPLSYQLLRPTLRLHPLLLSTGLRVSLSYWSGFQTAVLISETLLYEQNNSSHRFNLAYCTWSNGPVDVGNCKILRVLGALDPVNSRFLAGNDPTYCRWLKAF